MKRASGLFAIAAWLLCGGCQTPVLEIESDPADAQVFLDGRELPSPRTPIGLSYYGTTQLSARQGSSPEIGTRLRDRSLAIELPEPFSPWFFPLDFVLETCTYPFAGERYRHAVRLSLEPRPALVDGISPRELPAIRLRAEQALRER